MVIVFLAKWGVHTCYLYPKTSFFSIIRLDMQTLVFWEQL